MKGSEVMDDEERELARLNAPDGYEVGLRDRIKKDPGFAEAYIKELLSEEDADWKQALEYGLTNVFAALRELAAERDELRSMLELTKGDYLNALRNHAQEREWLSNSAKSAMDQIAQLSDERDALRAQLKDAMEALEWYAEERNYYRLKREVNGVMEYDALTVEEIRVQAREALAKIGGKRE